MQLTVLIYLVMLTFLLIMHKFFTLICYFNSSRWIYVTWTSR